jgi:carbamoyltransferase
MSYNILGINPFHNGSVCVLSDGEIVYFLEEERLSRKKYDANPFRVILDVLNTYKIDEVAIAGINSNQVYLTYTKEDPFYSLIRKFYPKLKFNFLSDYHHLTHSLQSYHNSGFKNSLGVVIDGGGSFIPNKGIEMDSIYLHSPTQTKDIYKNYLIHIEGKPSPQSLNVASAYSAISQYLGFKQNEEGKTMGLSSYGKYNPLFSNFFTENNSNINILSETYDLTLQTPNSTNYLKKTNFNSTLIGLPKNRINSKIYSQIEKDLAFKTQSETQQIVGDYIEKYIKQTQLKHVCCSGGYFLNCVANYYLIKRFPNIEFYFEPISHDGGTAIGAAKLIWHQNTQNLNTYPQKTLYYGPQYSKEELLKGIKKYL